MMGGDRKKQLMQILGPRKEVVEAQEKEGDSSLSEGHELAKEMIDAFESKDAGALWSALEAAFELLDSLPHVEGEHLEE